MMKVLKKEHGCSFSLCWLCGVPADLEGQDFTLCNWLVCSRSRCGAVRDTGGWLCSLDHCNKLVLTALTSGW